MPLRPPGKQLSRSPGRYVASFPLETLSHAICAREGLGDGRGQWRCLVWAGHTGDREHTEEGWCGQCGGDPHGCPEGPVLVCSWHRSPRRTSLYFLGKGNPNTKNRLKARQASKEEEKQQKPEGERHRPSRYVQGKGKSSQRFRNHAQCPESHVALQVQCHPQGHLPLLERSFTPAQKPVKTETPTAPFCDGAFFPFNSFKDDLLWICCYLTTANSPISQFNELFQRQYISEPESHQILPSPSEYWVNKRNLLSYGMN